MDDLNIESTQSSPAITTDSANGKVVMSGDSYPENSFAFFEPVVGWIEGYLGAGNAPLELELHLLYLNTSSVKVVMDIFDLLEEAHGKGRSVAVYWYYDADNERIAELAEEFKEDCNFPFEIVRKTA